MVANKIFSAAFLAGLATALPAEKRQSTNIDTTVLNFALTLEHLENNFYKGALLEFSAQDFEKAGFSADYYNKLHYIAYDEQQHVSILTGALQAAGATPVMPCTYNFPYKTPRDFVTLSSVIENVGTSAYLGGAPLITSKSYLTVAGSILAVEALHTSYQRNAIGEVPFPNPLETSLDPTTVYSIASAFIKSCPAGSALPFKAFPTLSAPSENCAVNEGSQVTFTTAKPLGQGTYYLTYISGLSYASQKAKVWGNHVESAVPSIAMGQTYVLLTSTDMTGASSLNDTQVLAGPAIIEVNPPQPALNFNGFSAHQS